MRTLANHGGWTLVAVSLLAACGSGSDSGRRGETGSGEPITWDVTPTAVDFGAVSPGERVERRLTLTNPGPDPVPLVVTLLPGADPAIALAAVPPSIPAGGTAELAIVYAPSAPGSHAARIRVEGAGRLVDVGASGLSPGVRLSCTPEVLALPPVAAGVEARGTVACVVAGWSADGSERIVVGPPAVIGDGFSAVFGTPPPAEGLAPGTLLPIEVSFRGDAPGPRDGRLVLATSVGDVVVGLSASAWAVAPCELRAPGAFDLGLVPPDLRARVELPLENLRPDAGCRIASARLVSCDPGFRLESAGPFDLAPGATLGLPLRFGAMTPGAWRCELALGVDGGDRELRIQLRAFVDPSCLHVATGVDFGGEIAGCLARRTLTLHSACGPTIALEGIELADGPFAVIDMPPLPVRLATGDELVLGLGYRPDAGGDDAATMRLRFADGMHAAEVGLHGLATDGETLEDEFRQNERPTADILVVIDNSTSMVDVLPTLANNLRPFLSFAQAQEIDYRLAVTTTGLEPGGPCPGGVGGGEDGRLFPVDGDRVRVIDPRTPHMEEVWSQNFRVGACRTGPSMPIEAALRALSPPLSDHVDDPRHPEPADGNAGFLRPEAYLKVLFITNRVDESPGSVAGYLGQFFALKPNRRDLVNIGAITGDHGTGCSRAGTAVAEPGDRILALVEATNGYYGNQSICAPDWEPSLRELSAAAFGFHTCFFLSEWPADRDLDGKIADADLEVRLNGTLQPSRGDQGQQIWKYSTEQNALCFNPLAVPEPGMRIVVRYSPLCL